MASNANVTRTKVKEIMGKPYARRLVPDETGGYAGSILEFPGCFAEGDSTDEAMANLNEAAESWVESALSSGYAIREPIEYHGYSGKIALRLPRSLHQQVAEMAELEDSSINQLLVTAISHYIGGKQLMNSLPRAAHITNNNVVVVAGGENKYMLTGMRSTETAITDKSPPMQLNGDLLRLPWERR